VTSYSELRRDALAVDRWNRLHPNDKPHRSNLERTLEGLEGPFISAGDNVRLVADQIRQWLPGTYVTLGVDGFGRSDARETLRRHFEVDAEHIVFATLSAFSRRCHFEKSRLPQAIEELGLDPEQVNAAIA